LIQRAAARLDQLSELSLDVLLLGVELGDLGLVLAE
jgi:hypothetical protein